MDGPAVEVGVVEVVEGVVDDAVVLLLVLVLGAADEVVVVDEVEAEDGAAELVVSTIADVDVATAEEIAAEDWTGVEVVWAEVAAAVEDVTAGGVV